MYVHEVNFMLMKLISETVGNVNDVVLQEILDG